MLSGILLTLFLVLLNGFFVAAEFAIVKVRSSQIEVRNHVNKRLSLAAKTIVGNLDAYLAATQLGITLASLGLGWVGEKAMSRVIHALFGTQLPETANFIIAFSLITVMHIVFGELAPKSLAIRYPTNTTFAVAWPLKIFAFVFRPFIWVLNGFANLLLRMVGIKPIHGSEIHTEEELKMIITESHEGGAIEQTERELIQNVFEFDDRRVWDIQTIRKNIAGIKISTPVREAIDLAIQEGYSRYPVFDESTDDIKGIIYTKDLMRRFMEPEYDETLITLLRPAYYIPESRKIKDVLKELQQKRIQLAIVTNEVGEVSGLVTMEDILEELVGEIQDEYDNEVPVVDKISEREYRVSAHSPMADINKYLPISFEESEQYETLSGLISYEHDTEVEEGETIELDYYNATIIKLYRNSVETVLLTLKEGLEVPNSEQEES